MRVYVANPPFFRNFNRQVRWSAKTSGAIHPPVYLAYAAATLLEAGHKVRLIDAVAEEKSHPDFVSDLRQFGPDMVVLETSTPSIVNDIRLVATIKKDIDVPVVLTGPHVSALPKRTLRESNADIVTIHEYDLTLVDIADTLEKGGNLKKVKGIAFKTRRKITLNPTRPLIKDLDKLPYPLMDQLPVSKYRDTLLTPPFTFIVSARGCPFRCNYCNWPDTMFGRLIRNRDPKKVVDEVENVINKYKLRTFKFFDDTFTVDKRRVKAVCNEMMKRGIDTPWICNARVDTLDEETLRIMKRAGAYLLKVGVESGNQEVLNWIQKGTNLPQIRKFFKLTRKVGIQTFGSFMIGYPQETDETIRQTFEFAKEIEPDMVQFVILQPLPGTYLYGWMEKGGMLPKNVKWNKYITEEGYVDLVFKHPKFTQDELRNMCSRMWSGYYLRPGYMMRRFFRGIFSFTELQRNIGGIKKIFRYRSKPKK